MHCVDGKDYSVFSILPPYNNLHAQLIADGKLISEGVTLTYEAMIDHNDSINTTSVGKSNFWEFAGQLYGSQPAADIGLTGNPTPSTIANPLQYNAAQAWFEAEGLPIFPVDDQGRVNYYPMVKVTARDSSGVELATAPVVLPVSDEMSCSACHAANSPPDAKPSSGWSSESDAEKAWKENILALHDERQAANSQYQNALTKGYGSAGLLASSQQGKPVLCASCHASNALLGTGISGITPLTTAMHSSHGKVKDPGTNRLLNDSENRDTCYLCHPGATTQCLRGAMGKAVASDGSSAINCQSCHGNMQQVGSSQRQGWLDQPDCQSCHHDGQRELVAVNADGSLKKWSDQRFATNANTPASGFSLYRYSKGHGDLQCEACHGATHAIYPSSHESDNQLAIAVQGHSGTISKCDACHTTVPFTTTGGPHGMHTTGQRWVDGHENSAEQNSAACTACHGSDYRGSALSVVTRSVTFDTEWGNRSFSVGDKMGCYDCHNGPKDD
ncbi:MAG: hypothetical protein HQL49_10015 [Gammaproteobacteria bacterium]|nr:hypothetical protein [Gammaproteobacteria bacterium]